MNIFPLWLAVTTTALVSTFFAAADDTKGDNSGAFAVLCEFINMAKNQPPSATQAENIDDVAAAIGALNMSAANPPFDQLIDHEHDLENHKEKSVKPTTGEEAEKWADNYDFWRKAKGLLEEKDKKATYASYRKLTLNTLAQKQIQTAAEIAAASFKKAAQLRAKVTNTATIQSANKALFGVTGAQPASPYYGSNGCGDVCGKPTTYSNTQAGNTLQLDALCLCGFFSGAGDAGDSCGGKIGTDTTNLAAQAWTPNTNPTQWWANIEAGCAKLNSRLQLTTTNVLFATAKMLTFMASDPKGTNKEYQHVLGNMEGNGSEGCKGKKDSNGGKCVAYKPEYFTTGQPTLPWLVNLQAAATAAAQMATAAKDMEQLESKLKDLNTSAHQLIYSETAASHSQPPTTEGKESGTGEKQKQKDQCETIQTAKLCKEKQPKCEWKDPNDDDGEHCKLNETHAAQQATQAGTAGGNGETKTTDKCGAAKTPEECAAVKGEIPKDKKAVCGWIEEKCKDSSILVTKKFAFSVVSAAFVALLF
uniref:Variant surface glycoprotein 1125.1081 n=1 Tax=Trypanosoma brucei TaxID=5691 RepID=A0A1J0R6G1_9TRYP|nr:variant surface glycoprotein 1125.1081 [Trypanosoma brucei]